MQNGLARFGARFAHYANMDPNKLRKINPDDYPVWDSIVINWAQRALDDQKAAESLADRLCGKAKETVDMNVTEQRQPTAAEELAILRALRKKYEEET